MHSMGHARHSMRAADTGPARNVERRTLSSAQLSSAQPWAGAPPPQTHTHTRIPSAQMQLLRIKQAGPPHLGMPNVQVSIGLWREARDHLAAGLAEVLCQQGRAVGNVHHGPRVAAGAQKRHGKVRGVQAQQGGVAGVASREGLQLCSACLPLSSILQQHERNGGLVRPGRPGTAART